MCGAPQRWFERLIAPMRLRSSAEILGLPTSLRDRSRQYDWNPARCQRMIVSGRRIAIALRTEGNVIFVKKIWQAKSRDLRPVGQFLDGDFKVWNRFHHQSH